MDDILVGKKIKKYREKTGLTQEEFAEKAGVSYITLFKLEQGQSNNPTLKNIKRIADALGVTIDDLTK